MAELISNILVLIAMTVVARVLLARFEARERRWMWASFGAHMAAAIAQVVLTIHYFGGGDMLLYFSTGEALRKLVLAEFDVWAWPVLKLALGMESSFPILVIGPGTSTGVVSGVSAIALLFGASTMYGVCFMFSTFAFAGKVAMYRAFREIFPVELRTRVLIAVFFIPSVVFWSSGILKEPIAMGGLGFCVLGFWRFVFTKHRVRGAIYTGVGALAVALVKPYTLFPLAAAAAVWVYWSQRSESWSSRALIRSGITLIVASFALAYGLQYLGEVFPQYAVENVTRQAAYLQGLYYSIEAGSTYTLGEATADAQVSNVPMALLSSLFRPVIFEVHNAVSLLSALETTAILVLIGMIAYRQPLRVSFRRAVRSPIIVFFAVFVVLLGVGLGLGAPNLGSLSRYRITLMPFYILMIASLLPPRRVRPSRAARLQPNPSR